MPRSYAKLLTSIWRDADFRALDAASQRLYLVLISQPDLSSAGVLPIRISKWASLAADTTVDGITDAFDRLRAGRFALVDERSEEALIRSFIRHDGGYATPNIHKAIRAAIANIESGELRAAATIELDNAPGHKPSERYDRMVPEQIPHPSSQQPAPPPVTSSQQPAPRPRHPQLDPPADPDLPAAAAAAIEILIAHKLRVDQPAKPTGYRRALTKALPSEHGLKLCTYLDEHPDANAPELAQHVLGLTEGQLITLGAIEREDPHVRAARRNAIELGRINGSGGAA